MNRKKLLITICSYGIAFIIGYFVNFFLTRYITDNVGTDAYGFVSLCKTIATYAVIATTALNSFSARFIAIAYHNGDLEKANTYYSSVFWANVIVGVGFILLAIVVIPFIDQWFSVPNSLQKDVTCLFLLVFLNLLLSLVSTAFQASAYIKNKLLFTSVFKGISFVAEALTLLCLYSLLPAKIFYTGIGIICATAVNFLGYLYITKKYAPELIIRLSLFKFDAVKKLVFAGVWNSFNSLGNTLNSGLDLVVSNSLLGGIAMGQASIVKSIVNIFQSLYQMVAQPFQPIFLKLYADDNKNQLLQELKFSMKISGMLSNIAFAIVVGLGLVYYKLWIPNQNCMLLYYLTIIAVATSIFEGPVYPLYYIYTLTIKNKIPCIVTIIGGVINVVGMYILIRYTSLGIYAVFLTTAFVMIVINGVTNPIYMAHCLKLKWTVFYPVLFKHCLSCCIMIILVIGLSRLIIIKTWSMFIVVGVAYCLICALIHICIVFGRDEKKSLYLKIMRN